MSSAHLVDSLLQPRPWLGIHSYNEKLTHTRAEREREIYIQLYIYHKCFLPVRHRPVALLFQRGWSSEIASMKIRYLLLFPFGLKAHKALRKWRHGDVPWWYHGMGRHTKEVWKPSSLGKRSSSARHWCLTGGDCCNLAGFWLISMDMLIDAAVLYFDSYMVHVADMILSVGQKEFI